MKLYHITTEFQWLLILPTVSRPCSVGLDRYSTIGVVVGDDGG